MRNINIEFTKLVGILETSEEVNIIISLMRYPPYQLQYEIVADYEPFYDPEYAEFNISLDPVRYKNFIKDEDLVFKILDKDFTKINKDLSKYKIKITLIK